MGMKNVVAVIFVLVVTASSGVAQDQNRLDSQTTASDAKAILRQVAETYKNLRSYHFEGRHTTEQVIESRGLKNETKREELFVIAAIKPGRSRIESKSAHFSVTSVSDGKTKWVYTPGANEYIKSEEGAAKPGAGRLPAKTEAHLARATDALVRFSYVDHRLREAKTVGEEKLRIGRRQIDCLVIEAHYATAPAASQSGDWTRKLWIDRARNIVLREIQHTKGKTQWGGATNSKITHIFTVADVGEQVPGTLFTFVPPESAKEVAEMKSSPRPATTPRPAVPSTSRLVGRDAVAFALKDLDGNRVDMRALKGKVVLLDFWASWCGPCVAEAPHIEKLHRDFKNKGLVVLGLSSEEPEVARKFVKKKGYTFTTLVDEAGEVSMKYGISSIPQVFIIDRDGKVKWHARDYSPGKEVELRSATENVLKGVAPPAAGVF
ncbi:MAG: redoxin domain-containing protein [Blastocatellia bacterium]